MARKRKSSSGRSITLYGVITGLVLGVAAAVAVALFVTQVPMPFVDKASRKPPTVLLPDLRDAPDPNLGLHGGSAGLPGTAVNPGVLPPTDKGTPPGAADGMSVKPGPSTEPDGLAQLIDRLSKQQPPPVESQVSTPRPVATPSPPSAATTAKAQAGSTGSYLLQAGAFRNANDAEAMKARVIMLGLSANVQTANVNGTTIHRVRVGPFEGLDEMNQARSRLGSEKIETSVVRQQ